MSRQDSKVIIEALEGYICFLRAFGEFNSEIKSFQEFIQRFQNEQLTKALLTEMVTFRDSVHSNVRGQILLRYLPGKNEEQTLKEYYQALNKLGAAINPPKPKALEMNISKFKGAKRVERQTTVYAGDPKGVGPIVERSLELIEKYTKAIGGGDFEAAYKLTDSGLRSWMTLKRFVNAHEEAANEYGGAALQFDIDGFLSVLADADARKKSTLDQGWPKSTPKENRRARLIGFWIRDKASKSGCWGAFYIVEEANEFRIGKFEFYTQ